jgi:hypothetical protein
MTDTISKTTECDDCGKEVLPDHEWNCSHCGTPLCANCLLDHEDDCRPAKSTGVFRLRVFQVHQGKPCSDRVAPFDETA